MQVTKDYGAEMPVISLFDSATCLLRNDSNNITPSLYGIQHNYIVHIHFHTLALSCGTITYMIAQ